MKRFTIYTVLLEANVKMNPSRCETCLNRSPSVVLRPSDLLKCDACCFRVETAKQPVFRPINNEEECDVAQIQNGGQRKKHGRQHNNDYKQKLILKRQSAENYWEVMNKTTEFSSDSDFDSNTDHTSEINFYQNIEDLDSSSEVDNFSEFTPNLPPFNLVNKIPMTGWGNLTGEELNYDINKAYDTIVH